MGFGLAAGSGFAAEAWKLGPRAEPLHGPRREMLEDRREDVVIHPLGVNRGAREYLQQSAGSAQGQEPTRTRACRLDFGGPGLGSFCHRNEFLTIL